MKRQVLIFTYLVSFAAAAQADHIIFPPVTPDKEARCRLFCECEVRPGKVDRCSNYNTFGHGNQGSILMKVNPNPAACFDAVDDNLSTLSGYFGQAPEISLPTKEMATEATTLALPPQHPLPYSHLLEAAESVPLGDQLDKQIVIETKRILALTKDARSYATVGRSVSQWQSASAAAKRLIARVEGAEKALSLAKPWPKLREFAPQVWDLAICAHHLATKVATLGSRILNEGDIAWSFAFLGDWMVLRNAFHSSSGVASTGVSSFGYISKPFFSEPDARVKERTEKSLNTLLELRAFRSAVTGISGAIDDYTQDLDSKANARRNELEIAFDAELAAVTRIRDSLKAEQAKVVSLKSNVDAAAAERAKVQASIDKISTDISSSTSSLQSGTARRDQRRLARTAALKDLTAKRAAVDDAQQKLQAVALNCGGQAYETCADTAAKKDFDRRFYEANEVVAETKTSMAKAQALLKQSDDELLIDDKAILELRGGIASMRQGLKDLQGSREKLEKNLIEVSGQLEAGEQKLLHLADLMANLDDAMETLDKVSPNT